MADIVIVGGGASGLAAAVMCARRIGGERVLLLEKAPRVGKKLLATGNGTCNLSNMNAACAAYHGAQPSFAKAALAAFSPADAIDFFASLGVRCTVRENGRVYPLCEQAAAVLDCLRLELAALGVQTRCDTAVTALLPDCGGITVCAENGEWTAKRVLVACGGAASPTLGGCSDGYALLERLGHTKTPLFPAIVQIGTDKDALRAVKGIRADAALTLKIDGAPLASSSGEILFADYGVSGPAAMQLGRVAADWERKKKGTMTLSLDLLPMLSAKEVEAEVAARVARRSCTCEDLLTGLLQKRLGQTLLKAAGITPLSRSVSGLTAGQITAIARVLKNWELTVRGSAGLRAAQVTAGGMKTAEFSPQTMESKCCPRVYAAGEVLDIDGECGGYNLQWAWASAAAAARAMTEGL